MHKNVLHDKPVYNVINYFNFALLYFSIVYFHGFECLYTPNHTSAFRALCHSKSDMISGPLYTSEFKLTFPEDKYDQCIPQYDISDQPKKLCQWEGKMQCQRRRRRREER